jgi:hypothetical protein
VLAESFLEHHPDGRVTATIVDDDDAGERWRDEPFEALAPATLGLPAAELARLRTIYEPGPLSCALKPWMLRYAVAAGEPATHLDADCLVLGDLSDLPALAERHGVVLTAHALAPAPVADELAFVRWGTFNAGVLAAGQRGRAFLDWWAERCARHARTGFPPHVSSDQPWLALVPALFDHHVLDDGGVNVSGWSLHDRDVDWDGDRPAISGGPLRLFHFCGAFDPHAPLDYLPDGEQPDLGTSVRERPGAARVCELYARRLLAAGGGVAVAPSRFAALPDGTPLTTLMRVVYLDALLAAEASGSDEPPNPFADGAAPFLAWLGEPAGEGPASRYLAALRLTRPDVVAAFPAVPGADDEAYLGWVSEAAARGETDVPAALLPRT